MVVVHSNFAGVLKSNRTTSLWFESLDGHW